MLCLDVWSSQALGNASYAKAIPCYAKLGGKYVGNLRLCTSTSAYQVLRDIQKQASKLIPHAWRGFEDTMVWCDNHCSIPSGFAYKDDLTQEETEQVWSVLGKVQRFDVMWDDDDEHARSVLASKQIEHFVYKEKNEDECVFYFRQAWQDKPCLLPIEALFVNKTCNKESNPKRLILATQSERMQLVDLQAIKHFGVNELRLHGMEPTSWHACRNIKSLSYIGSQTSVPSGVGPLRKLESLWLENITSLPDDFGRLAINTLVLANCDLDLALVAKTLADTPTLKELRIEAHHRAGSVIPTELGLVARLEKLSFTCNNFGGSIPSELGKLTNLVTIDIMESEACVLDMTFPKEVLDLNISLSAKRYTFVI